MRASGRQRVKTQTAWIAIGLTIALSAFAQPLRLQLRPGARYWFREISQTSTSVQFPFPQQTENYSELIYELKLDSLDSTGEVAQGELTLLWAWTDEAPPSNGAAEQTTVQDPVLSRLIGTRFPIRINHRGEILEIRGVQEAVRAALAMTQIGPEAQQQYESLLNDEVIRFTFQWSMPIYPEEGSNSWTTEVPGVLPLVGVVRSQARWELNGERTVRGRKCREYRVTGTITQGSPPKPVTMGPVTVEVALQEWKGGGLVAVDKQDGFTVLSELSYNGTLSLHVPGITNPDNRPTMEISSKSRLERLSPEELRPYGIAVP